MSSVGHSPKIETYLVERGVGAAGMSDDELADLIREESWDSTVDSDSASLDRYLRLVPDLANRLVALDAAIDVVLRQRSHGGLPDARVVEELTGHYPHLAEHIREAAALNAGLLSGRSPEGGASAPDRELPCEFGPLIESGVPRYNLIRMLGQGAHGQVFLAEDRLLADRAHRPLVAIKLLAGGHRSERARHRLMDEAAKARRINHPNVVRVFDRGVSGDGDDFIVYEYVPGGTLDGALPDRSTKGWARQTARLIAQVARGVHAAHHAGLVHCDLKPGNVLIAEDGSPKVADFGVAARVVDPGDEVIRGTAGGPLGNLAFIAPEQFREEPGSVAIPADLYALGGLFYYGLMRSLPNGRTAREIAHRHTRVQRDGTEVTKVATGLDADIDAIIQKSLAERPSDRFASAAEFADELERWAERRPVVSRRSGPVRRAMLWARRRPLLAAASIGCGVLTGGALMAMGMAYQQDQTYAVYEQKIMDANQVNARVNFGANLLPTIWLMEQIDAVSILGRKRFDEYMFGQRYQLLKTEIDRARAEGRENQTMPLIWEVTLGHWMLSDKQDHPELRGMLARSLDKWRAKVGSGDDMVRYVSMLHAAAIIKDHWLRQGATFSARPMDADTFEEVAEAAGLVREYIAQLPSSERYSPAHILAVRALKNAYSGRLLADRNRLLALDEEYRRIELGHILPR